MMTSSEAWWGAGLLAGVAGGVWWRRSRLARPLPAPGANPRQELVFDLTFIFIAFDNLPRLLTGHGWSAVLLLTLTLWRLTVAGAVGLYGLEPPSPRAAARWLAAEAVFAAGAVGINLWMPQGLPLGLAAAAAGVHALLLLGGAAARRLQRRAFRGDDPSAGLLLLGALILMHPWFSPGLAGTGDARLYQETLHDFLNQVHAGIWPPWVSQSEIAPFGAVFPFRVATYHYYFAALLDRLCGGRLPLYALQHLTVILSAVAGGWAMLAVLRKLCPGRPWLTGAFSALYLASPAWLGPLYGFSMFFTYMTLPFVPLALAGARPAAGARDLRTALCHGAALAAVWQAHPPIGFWVSLVVIAGQLIGFALEFPSWRTVGRCLAAWLAGGCLCLGLFVSLWELRGTPTAIDGNSLVVGIVRSVFPQNLLPANSSPAGLADIQVGYALLLALGVSLGAAVTGPRWLLVWVLPALGLVVLVIPIPGLTAWLWQSLPGPVFAITNIWPMQRIMPLLAGLAVLAGAVAFDRVAAKSARWTRGVAVLVSAMVLWSGWEAAKYVRRGHATVLAPALSDFLSRPENSPLLGNWLAFQRPLPEVYHINEYQDAALFNRVWSADLTAVQSDNLAAALARTAAVPPISARFESGAADTWRVEPAFVLEPDHRYLLQLLPGPQTSDGQLLLSSPDFQRTGILLGPDAPSVLMPLWTSTTTPQQLVLNYIPSAAAIPPSPAPVLFEYRLIPYDRHVLPVAVHQFAPYRVTVSAAAPGWLETHRIFVRGYRATVDGREVGVRPSDDARVMLPVPAGRSEVRLDYVGTVALRGGYAVMAGAWLLFGVWQVAGVISRRRRLAPH